MLSKIKNNQNYFVYDNFKRFFFIVFLLIISSMGIFLLVIDNWFVKVFGALITLVMFVKILDMLLFKKLSFTETYIIKEWYLLGEKKFLISELKATTVKNLWSGIIFFDKPNSSFFERLAMNFETFPIGNKQFKKIKEILIEKNVIQGNEHEWNY
jgi:hypothetical protein